MMGGSMICPGPLVVVEKGSWVEAPEVGEDPRPNALPPPRASLLTPAPPHARRFAGSVAS